MLLIGYYVVYCKPLQRRTQVLHSPLNFISLRIINTPILSYCIFILLGCCPKQNCVSIFLWVMFVKTLVLALLELREPSKHHGRFEDDSAETVADAAQPFDPPSLCPHQSLCLSPSESVTSLMACLSSPTLIRSRFHLGILEWAPLAAETAR